MQKLSLSLLVVACALLFPVSIVLAADQAVNPNNLPATTQERIRTQEREQERIYGGELMTQQEREEYRQRMRSAQSTEEQERIRNEHHERMQERAKAQGLSLPDMPPPYGGGMGQGGGGMGGGRMGGGGHR